ncbi:ERI1 exoribonuclease 2 [Rhinatrema bivittatum]|uniref:ERI1 exoribonuclease 2 n=1 Tax=Rhinatrema bivittatum TaxID=194408 RepID=UPI00112828F2|nr:ERI1 exoribonuclease 2 [Rhinatrema bivittatum]
MATKNLAKQLGLIRKSSITSANNKNSSKATLKQIFDYLIIIDFESTCWKDSKQHYSQEIIEFPAVLLNTSNGEIESEFQLYVQPQEHPLLSEFCTELTGIKQDQVDAGLPLKICLSQFSTWIQKIQKENQFVFVSAATNSSSPDSRLCAFVTWSDWDLGVCLQYECKRKQLRKPDILNSWIDLRATYKLFYNRRPKGLNGALQDLGIKFSGREHSGLDDSRNTARLAWRMICDGCVMKITRSLDKVRPKMNSATRALNVAPAQGNPSRGDSAANALPNETSCDLGMKEEDHIPKMIVNSKVKEIHQGSNSKGLPVDKTAIRDVLTAQDDQAQSLLAPQTLINGLSTRLGYKQALATNSNLALHSRNGVKLGQFTSTPNNASSLLSPGLVLVSTTISSDSDVTDLDVSSSSDCLSVLADWEDIAVMPESQPELNNEPMQLEEKPNSHTLAGESAQLGMALRGSAAMHYNRYEKPRKTTLNPEPSKPKSIAYRSPDTTIYKVRNVKQALNCSLFKLPSAIPNVSKRVTNLSGTTRAVKPSMTSPDFPKRKFSTTRLFSPPRKQSFTILEDDMSSSNLSLPLTKSPPHVVPPAILKCMVNVKQPFKIRENGKMTPPFCSCGRRAKRLLVSNVGPNQGRAFYSCPVGKRDEGNLKGCGYFKWEYLLLKEKSPRSFLSTSGSSSASSKTNVTLSGTQQKKRLGLRPSMRS